MEGTGPPGLGSAIGGGSVADAGAEADGRADESTTGAAWISERGCDGVASAPTPKAAKMPTAMLRMNRTMSAGAAISAASMVGGAEPSGERAFRSHSR